MRKSLSSLFTKEWPRANHSHLFLQTSVKSESLSLLFKRACEWFARDLLKKCVVFTKFLTVFPLILKSGSLPSLFAMSLFFKEQRELFALAFSFFLSHSFFGKERITISPFRPQKTSNSLEKPKREFPTLVIHLLQSALTH